MAGPDAYMPLFIADYLGDTRQLSLMEHGAYMLLMMEYYRHAKPLPDDDAKLARIVSATVTEWETVAVTVREFFSSVIIDGKRVLVHKRIESQLETMKSQYEKRVAASVRANLAKAEAAARLKNKKTTATVSASVTEPVTVTVYATVTDTVPNSELRTSSTEEESEKKTSLRSVKENGGTRWPSDARVPSDWFEDAEAQCHDAGFPPPDLRLEAGKFERYWSSKAGKEARKTDWQKTFINWILKAAEDGSGKRKKLSAHEKFLRGGARSAGYELGNPDDNAGANGWPPGKAEPALLEAGLYGASRKTGV